MSAATIRVEAFTDPACPFAFSAEPALLALRWRYGDALEFFPRMVVLSESVDEDLAQGFTPAKLAGGMRSLQERYGMPMDTRERAEMPVSVFGCRAVVAARERDGLVEAHRVLRALRVGWFSAAGDFEALAGPDGAPGDDAVDRALCADMDAARHPLPAALALDHKLAGWSSGRRYTCPSLVFRRDGSEPVVAPGMQPLESYEVCVANLAPELERRAKPDSVAELLEWAPWPLATVEVAEVCELSVADAQAALREVADEQAVGPSAFWALRAPVPA